MRSLCAASLLPLAFGCATAGSGNRGADDLAGAPTIGASIGDDVVRVGGFGQVAALAVSRSRVYVVADGGVAIYDRLAQRWMTPVPLPQEGSRVARVTLAAADPTGDALWVTFGSRLWLVRPATRFITSVALVADARQLLVDRTGRGAYVFANGWWSVSPSGALSPVPPGQSPSRDDVLPSPDAQQILRETPGLQSFGALLTRDAQLRVWPLTTLARAPERNDVFAGTNGGGVFEVDPSFLRSTQMPYGMRGRGASAIALAADGVWIAEDPYASPSPDLAITFASEDLATWRWLSPVRGTLGVVSMAVRGRVACLATNAGAYVVDLDERRLQEPERFELAQVGRQLVAWATTDGCWIGGTSGTVRIPWSADSTRASFPVLAGLATFAFASSGDTVWAATQVGVRTFVGGRPIARAANLPASNGGPPLPNALGGAIRGLTLAGDGLALVTDGELWLTSGMGRLATAQRVVAPLARLGRIRRLVADDATLWLGGSLGAAAYSLRDRSWRFVALRDPALSFGLDAAVEDVRDVALSPRAAWLATGAGIVRVARGADGMPR